MKSNEQVLLRLKEDILLRGLSKNTSESYLLNARIFLKFCQRPAEQLDEQDIRKYLNYLLHEKKLAPSSINIHSAAIRFLFAVTLNKTLNYLQIPRQKKHKKLPEILTRKEVFAIINSCKNSKHKSMLSLGYGSGLRVSEIAALKVKHIDSASMRILVENGKGGKDRYSLLSKTCLNVLRQYWLQYRPSHPDGWLFLGTYQVGHISSRGVEYSFKTAVKRVMIDKNVSIHSLRHAFATHLLEDGATLLQVKELLGHSSIQSTTIYLHLANLTADLNSPFDHELAACHA